MFLKGSNESHRIDMRHCLTGCQTDWKPKEEPGSLSLTLEYWQFR